MAELGSINTRDVNAGTQAVGDAAGQRALAGSLSLAGDIVEGVAKADLRGDLQQDATEALVASKPQVVVDGLLPGDTAIAELHNEIRKHQATIAQASDSNARGRAMLAMQITLQNKQDKYGWMRDELQREYNNFIGASPEMTALGLNDASSTGGRAESESFLDQITGIAYGRGPLDFKMDPGVYQIGSIEFSREYDTQSELMSKRVALEQSLRALQAQGAVSARQAHMLAEKQMLSPAGGVSAAFNSVATAYEGIAAIRRAVAQGDSSHASALALADAEQQWKISGKPDTLRLLDDAVLVLKAGFNDVWRDKPTKDGKDVIIARADPLYESSNSLLEEQLAGLATLRDLIESDHRDVPDMLRAFSVLRGYRLVAETNSFRTVADLYVSHPGVMAGADDLGLNLGARSRFANEARSGGLGADVEHMFRIGSTIHGAQVLEIEAADLAAEDIAKKIAKDRAEATHGSASIPDETPREETAGAWAFSEVMDEAYEQMKDFIDPTAKGDESLQSSFSKAADPLAWSEKRSLIHFVGMENAMGSSLLHDTTSDPVDKAVIRKMRSSTSIKEMVDRVDGGRLNPIVVSMATMNDNYWSQPEGDSLEVWRKEIDTLASERFGPAGTPAVLLLAQNTEDLFKGVITFVVNEDAVYKVYDTTANPPKVRGGDSQRRMQRSIQAKGAINALRRIAATLTEQVPMFLNVSGNNDWLSKPGSDMNYLKPLVTRGAGQNARSLNDALHTLDPETVLAVHGRVE